VNVSGCHCELGGGEQGGWTGREEASFANHVLYCSYLSGLEALSWRRECGFRGGGGGLDYVIFVALRKGL